MKHVPNLDLVLNVVSEVLSLATVPFVLDDSVLTVYWATIVCMLETALENTVFLRIIVIRSRQLLRTHTYAEVAAFAVNVLVLSVFKVTNMSSAHSTNMD